MRVYPDGVCVLCCDKICVALETVALWNVLSLYDKSSALAPGVVTLMVQPIPGITCT